jgi:hypothetical protein
MRVFLLAGLLEIALGVAFLAAPVARTGVETTRSGRVPPLISFTLIASGVALTVTNALRKN